METVTIPDKVPHYPRILVGWLSEERITVPATGLKTKVYAARCERCGREVARTAGREHARGDLIRHRAACRPAVRK